VFFSNRFVPFCVCSWPFHPSIQDVITVFTARSAAYLSKGDAAAALADADQCVNLKPSWSKGYGRKGAALHALKRFDDAIDAYNKGLEVEPGSAALQEGLDEVMSAAEAAASASNRRPGGMPSAFLVVSSRTLCVP
jgi:stress-induced-phosphoprotein 1